MIPPDPSSAPRLTARQQEDLARMSLMDHLEELRKRIVWSILAIAVAFIPCWAYYRQIYQFLVAPLKRMPNLPPNFKLAYLGLTDPFILYFKMAALAAVFLAAPFLLYQLWAFIAPGLYNRERKLAAPFIFFTTLFFLSGGAFGYYVAFPAGARFLLGIGIDLNPVITVDKYFGFLMTVILGLGLMFELPILILLLSLIGVITPRFLLRFWRHAVVIIFILSAIITPTPDYVNLCIFALPAIGLYFLGVGAAFFAVRFRKQRERETELAAE
ncbi:MAG: twin-arginine translocase subunit TatC [Thermoanaerobaculia bacterium]